MQPATRKSAIRYCAGAVVLALLVGAPAAFWGGWESGLLLGGAVIAGAALLVFVSWGSTAQESLMDIQMRDRERANRPDVS
jgi:hypothetical protein